jgi:hypothetical protein
LYLIIFNLSFPRPWAILGRHLHPHKDRFNMRKKFSFVAIPLAAMLLSSAAHAAVTTELRVIGRIVPAACTMDLTRADVNYGTIALDSLNAATSTAITPSMSGVDPETTLNIVCDAPAQIAMNITDNRSSTVDNSVIGDLISATAADTFGMGADSAGTNIGAFTITGNGTTVDGAAGKAIESTDGSNWTSPALARVQNTTGWLMSWTPAASADVPEPVQNVAQVLKLNAAVVSSDNLETSVPVNLDGSVTMELVYL